VSVLLQVLQVKVLFFVDKASSEDHPVSRGQGEPLRGQRLRTANQGAFCGALQLEQFVEGRFGCEQGVTRSILSKV